MLLLRPPLYCLRLCIGVDASECKLKSNQMDTFNMQLSRGNYLVSDPAT